MQLPIFPDFPPLADSSQDDVQVRVDEARFGGGYLQSAELGMNPGGQWIGDRKHPQQWWNHRCRPLAGHAQHLRRHHADCQQVEIAGLAPGQFDIFNVDGAVNFLGGSILFIFLDGFLPKSDDVVNFVFADAILGLNNISSTRAGPGTWIRVRRCGRRVRRAAVPGSHRCDCGARACLNGALRRRTARLGLLSRRRKAA